MLTVARLTGLIVLVKALDVVLRGPETVAGAVGLAVWLTGGVLLLGERHGWPCVLLGGVLLAYDAPIELWRQHLVLLVGIALVATVTRDDGERLLLWRTQLSALYGIAALAKLNEAYLSGTVLSEALVVPLPLPAVVAASLALIGTELLLATTPWVPRLRRPGTAVAAALHGLALLVVAGGPLVTLRLLVFGSAAVLLHAACAGVLPLRRSASSRP